MLDYRLAPGRSPTDSDHAIAVEQQVLDAEGFPELDSCFERGLSQDPIQVPATDGVRHPVALDRRQVAV